MINLNKALSVPVNLSVKPSRIHNFIHSNCGKLWKSPNPDRFVQIINIQQDKVN